MPRIEPLPNYALYFPNRKRDRVIIGKAALVSLWAQEEFKYIQLGDFRVTIQFDSVPGKLLAKTSDDLPCKTVANFYVRVNEDADSLEKATRKCAPSRKITKTNTISHDDLKKDLESTLESLTENCVRQVAYLDLLQSSEQAKMLENSIRTDADRKMTEMGFMLLGCRVDVQPIAPSQESLAQNANLKQVWKSHLEAKDQIEQEELELKNKQEERKKEEENRSRLQRDKLDSEAEAERQRFLNDRDEQLRQLKIEDEKRKSKTEEERALIISAAQATNDRLQREKIAIEHERLRLEETQKHQRETEEEQREQERLTHQFELSKLRREEENKEKQFALERLQGQTQLAELESKQIMLKRQIAESESATFLFKGRAEAEIEQLKALAAHATEIEMNRALLTALPAILEKAYLPSQKLGDIKVLYVGGNNGDSNNKSQASIDQVLGSILSAMSTFPMLRETLRFLNKWEVPTDDIHGDNEQDHVEE